MLGAPSSCWQGVEAPTSQHQSIWLARSGHLDPFISSFPLMFRMLLQDVHVALECCLAQIHQPILRVIHSWGTHNLLWWEVLFQLLCWMLGNLSALPFHLANDPSLLILLTSSQVPRNAHECIPAMCDTWPTQKTKWPPWCCSKMPNPYWCNWSCHPQGRQTAWISHIWRNKLDPCTFGTNQPHKIFTSEMKSIT